MIFPELESLKDKRAETCQKIKSHGLPIIIFGARSMANVITKELTRFGIHVDGYAVDEKYFKPNKTFLGKPIYNFEELIKYPDKYVFVLGVNDYVNGGKRINEFLNNEKIFRYVILEAMDERQISFDYILRNIGSFSETFELLADKPFASNNDWVFKGYALV